jgi:sarcosine oxidase subunit beta
MAAERTNIAIIGAGVIGSALAMALAERGAEGVTVYDFDLDGSLSSSELNAGGVRATFHQPLNILTSKISIDYFAANAEAVGYRACGYLWMHDAAGLERSSRSFKNWEAAPWPYEVWDTARLCGHLPFIDRPEGIAGAIFSPRDGLLNPNLLKLHYRERAKAKGVRFVDRHLLRESERTAAGMELHFEVTGDALTREEKEATYQSLEFSAPGSVRVLADRVVNCAGPWARATARILGYDCPSYCVRRQVSLFDCREVDLSPYGMLVDPSGVYYHPEGGNILGGVAERDEARGQNFKYGGEDFFQEKIWSPLAVHSSKFEALRHLGGWGGLYEVSPDESAIIGEVKAFQSPSRVYDCHSFSGHGVMHSYGSALALAEEMIDGRSSVIDLTPFSGARFERGQSLSETAVI